MIETTQYSETVKHALVVLFGGGASDSLAFVGQIPNSSAASDIVLSDESSHTAQSLAARGYHFSHRFALLPSRESTRWLVPRNEDCQIVNGLELYPSFSIRATVYKSFAARMAAMDWPGWAGNTLWVASKQRFPIEKLVEEITEESRPQFSLSLGTAVSCRKLTVQVMRRNGEIIGYIKLPLTEQASARIQAEAMMLETVNTYPRIRTHVPAVLYASKWDAGHILFQTPIMGEPGPSRFTTLHRKALDAFHSVRSIMKPGAQLVREAGDNLNASAKNLGSKWVGLAQDALRAAARELNETKVRCGLGHGDFAPWNTRLSDRKVCLVDWEMASWDVPLDWDRFHFLAQTQSLLRQGDGPEGLPGLTNEKRALYILYLIHVTTRSAQDDLQTNHIAYGESQLRKQLQELSAIASTTYSSRPEEAALVSDDANASDGACER